MAMGKKPHRGLVQNERNDKKLKTGLCLAANVVAPLRLRRSGVAAQRFRKKNSGEPEDAVYLQCVNYIGAFGRPGKNAGQPERYHPPGMGRAGGITPCAMLKKRIFEPGQRSCFVQTGRILILFPNEKEAVL